VNITNKKWWNSLPQISPQSWWWRSPPFKFHYPCY